MIIWLKNQSKVRYRIFQLSAIRHALHLLVAKLRQHVADHRKRGAVRHDDEVRMEQPCALQVHLAAPLMKKSNSSRIHCSVRADTNYTIPTAKTHACTNNLKILNFVQIAQLSRVRNSRFIALNRTLKRTMLALTQLSNYLTLKGSFSTVSKPNFASKYLLESS